MGKELYVVITDDFDARNVYYGMRFHYKSKQNTDVVEIGFKADNKKHLWKEDTLSFPDLGSKVELRLETNPEKPLENGLPTNRLEITIFGVRKEQVIRKLEMITGINIRKYQN